MIVRDENGKELERYIAPDHSWIQTETFGARHIPSITEEKVYAVQSGSGRVRGLLHFIPENPPIIPEHIRKLLDGNDSQWGRNGHEWMGSYRGKAGGTTLDRARELFAGGWKVRGFPLQVTFENCVAVTQNEERCRNIFEE